MRLFILGAGGHGKVCAETAAAMGRYRSICFIDDDPARTGGYPAGFPVIGGRCLLNQCMVSPLDRVFIAIGDNRVRAAVYGACRESGWEAATLIHPAAVVSPSARIGQGTLVMPQAVVNAGAEVGENCILNTACVIEHDCVVSDHAHISPRAALAGGAAAGRFVHLGMGACVLPRIRVGANTIVGAGAVVVKHLPPDVIAFGVPALIHKRSLNNDCPVIQS